VQIKRTIFKKTLLAGICFSSAIIGSFAFAQGPMSGPKEPQKIEKRKLASGEHWYVLQNTNIEELRIGSNASISAPGRGLTMLVDGKEVPIAKGKYKNVELRVSSRFDQSPVGKSDRGVDDFRTALYVDESGVVGKYSITDAIQDGSYDEKMAKGITVDSSSENFNGLMITGDLDYTISDSTFDFRGNSDGGNISDFSGYGAAIAAYNEARVTLENVDIHTSGVARLATFTFGGADEHNVGPLVGVVSQRAGDGSFIIRMGKNGQ
jgi:hypothetical protein